MLFDRVRECIARSLQLDPPSAAALTESTTAADVAGWTSVAHLSLILDLEQTFGVSFDNREIASLGSVPAILQRLSAKGVRES